MAPFSCNLSLAKFHKPICQEDLNVDWPSRFAPCSLEVAFGAQCWHCLVPRTHGTRVHCSSTPLPGAVAGATGPSTACHRGSMQRVATNFLICRDTTSPLAQGRGDSRNVPLPLSACWPESAWRRVGVSDATRFSGT